MAPFQSLRFDVAVVLIAATVLLSAGIDCDLAGHSCGTRAESTSLPTRLAEAAGAHSLTVPVPTAGAK